MRNDIEFEEEFKTDTVNGLPHRPVKTTSKVPKLQFPDSPQFKGSAAVNTNLTNF